MTSIEQTGRSIEEATQLALDQLGVTEDLVDVEILDEGSRGFLGLGQAPVKVRVSLRDGSSVSQPASEPAEDRRTEAGAEQISIKASEGEPGPGERPMQSSDGDIAEISRDTLQHMLERIGSGGRAVVKSASDGEISLNIIGGDSAILIGKRGQTINALQYLLGVIVNRHQANRLRVTIDVEGYRSRREDALRSQALFLADKVRESGQEAVLESLDAGERRVIHTTLADDPDVYTYSEGQEPERYVVISPKK